MTRLRHRTRRVRTSRVRTSRVRTSRPRTPRFWTSRRWLLPAALVGCLLLTACSGMKADSSVAGNGGDGAGGSASPVGRGGRLTVGGADFTEMLVMQSLYGQLLTKAGFTVDYRPAASRDVYEPLLETGAIDVVPEYAATMTEFLNQKLNGANTPVLARADPDATIAAMRPLAASRGLDVLRPAAATDQNGFAVSLDFATRKKVSTLSQFATLRVPVMLAATTQCPRSPFCQLGLQRLYGLTFAGVLPTGFGTIASKQAVVSGQASMALVASTDGSLAALGLTLLTDDKKLQLAQNLVPVVNAGSAGGPAVAAALDPLSAVLTSKDLAGLNDEVNTGQRTPQSVATDYLKDHGLL